MNDVNNNSYDLVPVAVADKIAAKRALGLVWDEASKYGGREVEVAISASAVKYSFPTSDGRVGDGEINARFGAAIAAVLSESFRMELGNSRVDITGAAPGKFRISRVKSEKIGVSGGKSGEPASKPSEAFQPQPASAPTVESAVKAEQQSASHSQTQPSLLVIEDNPTFSLVLVRFLQRQGFKVESCQDGKVALAKLQDGSLPDLIISDLHMPNLSGDELVGAARNIARLRDVPIMLLTSDQSVEVELRVLELGADLILSKSTDPRVIHGYIQRLLARSRLAQPASEGG